MQAQIFLNPSSVDIIQVDEFSYLRQDFILLRLLTSVLIILNLIFIVAAILGTLANPGRFMASLTEVAASILWLTTFIILIPGLIDIKTRLFLGLLYVVAGVSLSIWALVNNVKLSLALGFGCANVFIPSLIIGSVLQCTVILTVGLAAGRILRANRRALNIAAGRRSTIRQPIRALRRALLCPAYLDNLPGNRIGLTSAFCIAGLLFGLAAITIYITSLIPAQTIKDTATDLTDGTVKFCNSNDIDLEFGLRFVLNVATFFIFRTLGVWLVSRAQKRTARKYQTIIDSDNRAPILFLRSFRQDSAVLDNRSDRLAGQIFPFNSKRQTLDEVVLDVSSSYGPVIAIGAPGEAIPPLGAARLYVRGDNWHDVVGQLAAKAILIILCVDETAGVVWEMEHIIRQGYLKKTLFLASPLVDARLLFKMFSEVNDSDQSAEKATENSSYLDDILADDKVAITMRIEAHDKVRLVCAKRLWAGTYWTALNEALMSRFEPKESCTPEAE